MHCVAAISRASNSNGTLLGMLSASARRSSAALAVAAAEKQVPQWLVQSDLARLTGILPATIWALATAGRAHVAMTDAMPESWKRTSIYKKWIVPEEEDRQARDLHTTAHMMDKATPAASYLDKLVENLGPLVIDATLDWTVGRLRATWVNFSEMQTGEQRLKEFRLKNRIGQRLLNHTIGDQEMHQPDRWRQECSVQQRGDRRSGL